MSRRRTVTRGLLHLSVGERKEAGPACGAAKDRACWTFALADVTCADCLAMERERRLPMSQADAIKAAVVARENEVLSELARRGFGGLVAELSRKWSSGEAAPGAVSK